MPGGEWLYREHGLVADSARALARGGVAKAWAIGFGFPRQRGFHFSVYERVGARMLAREVVRRGNFFCAQYVDSEDDDFNHYTPAMIAEYRGAADFTAWMAHLDHADPCWIAGEEVRALVPEL